MTGWNQRATIWILAVCLVIMAVFAAGSWLYLWPRTLPEHPIGGSISCTSGAEITGVWVAPEYSWLNSGHWADRQTVNGKVYYSSAVNTERYSLHIGCGGTPQKWLLSTTTGFVSGDRNDFSCQDKDSDPRFGLCILIH